ncbi:hypothetical protein [Tomitella gaofuii]|uniref:hypothetical protein n=1 Tax=Tomitella gaofuii TaxID=2760083 RepID=UPI001F303EAE|nr:hypothetical protein [Tomitella gaofuii]
MTTIDRSDEMQDLFNPDGTDREPEDDDDFWTVRPVLAHIRTSARARRVAPWGLLGVSLLRVLATVEPSVHLPAIVGGTASLNLFIGLVGRSGGGKGATEAAALDALDITGPIMDAPSLPVGSGEGIGRTYRPHGTESDAPNPVRSAIFTAGEVDTLAALGSRTGSTLMGQLRHMYMGETLGFSNAGQSTRITVARHTYRAGLIVGIQPLKAAVLLDDADGGTPQRFVWLPVTDPRAPSTRPDAPPPMTITVPRAAATPMPVAETARAAIDAHRLATLRGEDVDPLDGHKLLCQLKVAAALALLDERDAVGEADWSLAAVVMGVSAMTREACRRAVDERRRRANRARAHDDAERAEIVAEKEDERLDRRAREGIIRHLDRHPDSTRAPIRRSLKFELRTRFDSALDDLIAQEVVTSIGDTFRLA